MKRIYALWLALMLLCPAYALALTGQPYKTFLSYYEDDISLINNQEGRYILPLVLSKSNSSEDDGRVYYKVSGDVLNVTVTVEISGIIETCEVRLTVPAGMTYGDSDYTDYVNQNYHCVAFQMAMDTNTDAADRYPLVVDIRDGLAAGGGAYTFQWGVYTVECTLADGALATVFTNNGVIKVTPTPEITPTPVPDVDTVDEGDYIG